jgi:hypothetical protein
MANITRTVASADASVRPNSTPGAQGPLLWRQFAATARAVVVIGRIEIKAWAKQMDLPVERPRSAKVLDPAKGKRRHRPALRKAIFELARIFQAEIVGFRMPAELIDEPRIQRQQPSALRHLDDRTERTRRDLRGPRTMRPARSPP